VKSNGSKSNNRWTGVAGLLFPVCLIAGVALAPIPPKGTASAGEVATYFSSNSDAVLRQVFVVGFVEALVLLVFLGGLWNFLRRAEGETAGWSSVAFASGIAIFPGFVIIAATHAGLARVPSGAGAGMIWAIWRVSTFGDLMTTVITGVFIGAATLSALSSGAFPKWLVWLGIPASIGQLVMGTDVFLKGSAVSQDSVFDTVMLVLFIAWIGASGAVILRRAD
jgi:hypothetical protein